MPKKAGNTWKQQQLHLLRYQYGPYVRKWAEATDDRLIFCNTFRQMEEALRSLPAEPHVYVRVAMLRQMKEDQALMGRIIRKFEVYAKREAAL